MHIEQLSLKAFGRFTDQTLDFNASDCQFHLVYGRNESGKSTTMRALNALLFGFPTRTSDDYIHRSSKLRVGGKLVDGDQTLDVVRRKGSKRTLLTADESAEIPESMLAEMIGGINESEFKSRFGLSHEELVAGGQSILAGEGDLGQILFAAGAGLGQLRDILASIESDAKELFSSRGSKPAINAAIAQMDEKRTQLRSAQVPPSRFVQLQRDIATQQAVVDRLENDSITGAENLARLESMLKAVPLLPRWRDALSAVEQSANVIELDEAFTERRRSTAEDLNAARNRSRDLQQQIAEIELKLESMPADPVVLLHETEIQRLFQEITAHDEAEMDSKDLGRPLASVIRKMTASLRGLSIKIESGDDETMLEQIGESIERVRISDTSGRRIIELANTRSSLDRDREAAKQELAKLENLLETLQTKLSSETPPPDTSVLAEAMQSIGDPQDWVDTWNDQRAEADRLAGRCDLMVRKLDGFEGTADEAIELKLPSSTMIDRGEREIRDSFESVRAAKATRDDLIRQREQCISEKADVREQDDLPTENELNDARQTRDQSIDEISPENLAADLTEVRSQVVGADRVVDTMRQHHERVTRMRMLESQIDQLTTRVSESENAVTQCEQAFENAKTSWNKIWADCGVAASKPEKMRLWLSDHQSLRECVTDRDHGQKQVDDAKKKWDTTRQRILAAIPEELQCQQPKSTPEDSALQWIQTIDRVTAAMHQNQKRWDAYQSDLTESEKVQSIIPEARDKLTATENAITAWKQEWKSLTSMFNDEVADPNEMVERLNRITELVNQQREANDLVERRRSAARGTAGFVNRVQRLATTLADEKAAASADLPAAASVVQQWFARLQTERSAVQTRSSLTSQLDSLVARRAEAGSTMQDHESVLAELCKEAVCDSPDDLPERERAARVKQADEAQLAEIRNQLLILCRNDSIDDFVEQASKQKPEFLEIEIEKQRRILEEARTALSAANQSLGAMKHESDAINGRADAAGVSQEMQLLMGKLGADVARYTRYRVATSLLRQAIEDYRQENQSPILKIAEDTFADLTLGRYKGLTTDYDTKGNAILCAVPAGEGPEVPAQLLSTGTADVLYLTLRLASLKHHLTEGKRIPFVVDDCLVQLDDPRSIAAMQHFSRLSEQTQVIMFTHHEHLIDLAREHLDPSRYHIHDLSGELSTVKSSAKKKSSKKASSKSRKKSPPPTPQSLLPS